MPDEPSAEMLAALVERDRVREYLDRLNGLRDAGSVTPEQYETAQADYSQRLDDASGRVEELRQQVEAQLDEVRRSLDSHRSELGKLEARFKVQEIPLTKLQSDGVQHRRAIRSLQEQEKQLASLVDAESAEGLAAPELEPAPIAESVPTEPKAPRRAAAIRGPEARPAPVFEPPEYEEQQAREGPLPRTPLRIASLAAGAVLLISVFLPWLAPTEALGTGAGADPGVVVTFLAGLGGLVCGVAAAGAAFLPWRRVRGSLHLLAGLVALAALVAAVLLEEIPLLNSYFRELVVMREGFYAYIAAAAAIAVLGIIELRRT
ncbi:MAG: hypothetical protein M0R22_05940 [Dehalococcoidia bacterium]|jgi:hypothetical protein|nr:hypothetical protein [Dehalococcoidia bacterium]